MIQVVKTLLVVTFMHSSVIIEFYAMISMLPKFILDIPNDKTTSWSSTPPVPAGTPIPSEYVLLIHWLNMFFKVKKFNNFWHLFCVDYMGSYSIFDVFLLIDLIIMETQCWVITTLTGMKTRPQSRPNPPPPS